MVSADVSLALALNAKSVANSTMLPPRQRLCGTAASRLALPLSQELLQVLLHENVPLLRKLPARVSLHQILQQQQQQQQRIQIWLM
jgi:hypothetical protein